MLHPYSESKVQMHTQQTVSLPHVCRTLRFIKNTSDCRCDNDIKSLACHSISNPYSLVITVQCLADKKSFLLLVHIDIEELLLSKNNYEFL